MLNVLSGEAQTNLTFLICIFKVHFLLGSIGIAVCSMCLLVFLSSAVIELEIHGEIA